MPDIPKWGAREQAAIERFEQEIASGKMGKKLGAKEGLEWLKTIR